MSSNAPINLLHLNTPSKLSYWIKHLPYYKLSKSYSQNSHHAPSSSSLKINQSELSLSQQIADIFYQNSLSGCVIHKWTKYDYQEILNFYKDTLNFNIKHEHIHYVYQLINESQQYYKNNIDNKDDHYSLQRKNKNWMTDTYNIYVLNINEIQRIITNQQPEQDCKKNEKIENNPALGLSIKMPSEDNINIHPNELYIKSPTKKWRACRVVDVLNNGKLKIHYTGFNSKFDEVVDANSQRLTRNKPDNVVPKQYNYKRKISDKVQNNKRIWVQSPRNNMIHRECMISDEKENKFKIHFISYNEKHDMWIDKTSACIKSRRPLGNELVKGDNLSCYNEQFNGWLEVEVLTVDNENDRVEIGWIGSNDLKPIWLPTNSKILSIQHKKHNAPAPCSSQ